MERWRVSLESSYFASRSVFQSSLDVKSFLRFFFNEFKCPTLSIRTVQASRIKASSFNRVVARRDSGLRGRSCDFDTRGYFRSK